MKFFTIATAVLPVAMAAVYRAAPVEARDISLTVDASDAFDVLTDLIKTGEIQILGPADEHDKREIAQRSDVPGLHCGYARALRCVGATAGTLNSCFWAAISRGADIKDDASCLAAATALRSNLPNDCKLCLGIA
ncbi:hypothetical protein M409DRAFT_29654 [Zasmidium cellare ATCC 36951]|uniref:Fungal calcium binding protein domain-containing protein n=1 Tax=Zasmidium cellare ATCC 36951 TaxID=1080233 RepID=A0A6A6BYH5_ZASCE|nr:uncharacterized protein M409DRAFT_29654 [Zasmidium cellare ATCC 36951]KAF2159844.1 hypothetical protein M409DRAFT_29654 [Zasmidium cellare ATCC 36951]